VAKTPRKARKAAPDAPAPAAAADPAAEAETPPVAAPVAAAGPDRGLDAAPVDLLGANVETWDLDELYPYDRNTRLHSDEQIAELADKMQRFGWTMPLLVREDGGLIAGHARWQAAQRLKLKKGPVIVARGWSEEMIRAYVIWDNRSAELASWDLPMLRLELGELEAAGLDLSLTGFTLGDLEGMESLAGAAGGAPPDPIGDPPDSAYREQYGVVVVCADERDQEAVYTRLRDEGLNVKVVKV
jgi:ParB-like chromosome segregation protein Spo0J